MKIYEEKLKELEALRNKFKNFAGYKLNRNKFDEFYINGNRLNYENEYFSRRGCLIARAADAIVNRGGNSDAELAEIIDAVCDEFTWALPAHIKRDTKKPEKVIDLFSAETAQTLSEIMHYIRLEPRLCEKIRSLLHDRIIEPFESNEFWWETSVHNWAAVCSGCVGMVYLYEFPERFQSVKQRILNSMKCFLSGYGDDGACLEGLGYWGYGFGYFVYFSELLRRTDGCDLLSNEKIARIAKFQQHMFLAGGVSVSFSDGFRNGGFNIGLTCFLRKEFGKRIKIPDLRYRADYDECYRFAGFLRSFLWHDNELIGEENDYLGERYFENAQWYVNKGKKFSFAAKGGNNDEPHNHNDIGCFIIADNEEQLIADFGAGEYTSGYFNDEHRYEYFCTSSEGHSVPIIDGKFQKKGAEYEAEIIRARGNEFVLDISGAYGISGLKGLKREFKIHADGVTLHDKFNFSGHKITERLVSLIKPESINGDTKIKGMIIKSNVAPNIGCVTVKNHSGKNENIYTLDYEVNSEDFECDFII